SACPGPKKRRAAESELDLDVDARGQIKLHQGIDCLRSWIDDIEKTLVRPHFELLTAFLVDVRRTVDRKLLDSRRQRDWPTDLRAGAFRGVHDLAGRRIENPMVERLETDADILAVHCRVSL